MDTDTPSGTGHVPHIEREFMVAGITTFPEHRWRECILFYLFGVWGNKQIVTDRPKIRFDTLTLRLRPDEGRYHLYGSCPTHRLPRYADNQTIKIGDTQTEVEQALVRFVKNNLIKMLEITFRDGSRLYFWKCAERRVLGMTARGMPKSLIEAVEGPSTD